ncbi:hypothetical protein [Methylobrevis pamukkalensis]|nr:hypothetical protein [Methylobrevis pamukkalensis]
MILIAAALLAGPATAGELPRFDPKSHCTRLASLSGGYSEGLFGICFRSEQSDYDELKARWSGIAESIATHCQRVATMGGGGSYGLLKICIDSEIRERETNSGAEFKF